MDPSSSQPLGKSALQLAEAISLYDPTNPPITGRNLLSQVPPVNTADRNVLLEFVSEDACRHNYVTKVDQTSFDEAEPLHGAGVVKVHAICSKCRWHLQLVVTNTSGPGKSNAKAPDHPHVFVYKSGHQCTPWTDGETMETGQIAETFHYECIAESCQTFVSLRLMSPILNSKFTALLTDPELIRRRAMTAFASQPQRLEGMAFPSPITVLDNLRLYLNNALRFPDRSKPITQGNKRFMVSFGIGAEPCRELLEFLGFTQKKTDGSWEPPNLGNTPSTPYQDPSHVFVDDVIHELICLINQVPPTYQRRELQPASLPETSDRLIERALSAMPNARSIRQHELEEEYYDTLGVMYDEPLSRIFEAYEFKTNYWPESDEFTTALKAVAGFRGGQDQKDIEIFLHKRKAAANAGPVDLAWKDLQLEQKDSTSDDEFILALYRRIDADPKAERRLRTSLLTIADSLGNQRLRQVAKHHLNRLDVAYAFLSGGVGDETELAFIDALRTAKVVECPNDEVLADIAVQTIRNHRNSPTFIRERALANLPSPPPFSADWRPYSPPPPELPTIGPMDVRDAYTFLEIGSHDVDDRSVEAAYIIAKAEPTKDQKKVTEAINLIIDHRDSDWLRALIEQQELLHRDPYEWPVGLTNIGNTCYLNSLLQYFFSLKPFRELVLDLDKFQLDLNDEASIAKREVAYHSITKKQVEEGINVLRGLKVQIENMIKTPKTAIAPTEELAKLILGGVGSTETRLSSPAIEASSFHVLGEIDGAPVLGPPGPPMETPKVITEHPLNEPTVTVTAQDVEMNEISPGDDRVTETDTTQQSDDQSENVTPSQPEQPTRAPPVPPRPSPAAESQVRVNIDIHKQQDVSEVLHDVLFRAQCALKKMGMYVNDSSQADKITEMFRGNTHPYVTKGQKDRDFPFDLWLALVVNVASKPRDIYDALDQLFDPEIVDTEDGKCERYGALGMLPPILQIHVQRTMFDKEKGQSYKSDHHLKFPERIFMGRYWEQGSYTLAGPKYTYLEKRYKRWDLKKKLGLLQAKTDELTKNMLSKHGGGTSVVPDGLPKELEDCDFELMTKLFEYHKTIDLLQKEIDEILDRDDHVAPYRLHALFFHSGSAQFGHYWVYIYDHRKDIWRKYNDAEVTEVRNIDEIFKEREGGSKATPYFVVYIDEHRLDQLAEPLCREIDPNMMEVN